MITQKNVISHFYFAYILHIFQAFHEFAKCTDKFIEICTEKRSLSGQLVQNKILILWDTFPRNILFRDI